eukprot:3981423-Heterocapsa_arctica.AAC.1
MDEAPEECYCGAICTCLRRYERRVRHTRRSSLKSSWIRARRELKEVEGDERVRQECLGRHPGIEDMELDRGDEEAWESYFHSQLLQHEER